MRRENKNLSFHYPHRAFPLLVQSAADASSHDCCATPVTPAQQRESAVQIVARD